MIKRFFEAFKLLKEAKIIHGKQTFTTKYGINRWNLNSLQKDMSRDIFQTALLIYYVNDYGISAEWLLTGKGGVFTNKVCLLW